MRWRSASRTSPSQRDNDEGSLMLGLKYRWLTVRSSTLTLARPTRPSAVPNPVMLLIMSNLLSYGTTRRLSIPELPAHAVVIDRPRSQEPRHRLVLLADEIPHLIAQYRL